LSEAPVASVDVNRGGSEALVHAFNQARGELLASLLVLTGNDADAQDILQNAFLRCWQARADLDQIQNLRAWIWRVAVNAAHDLHRTAWRRRAKPLSSLPSAPPCRGASPADAVVERERWERLQTAVQGLRREEREVFALRQNGDLTFDQIASMRGAPVGTVKTQIRRALQKLRRALQEAETAGEESPVRGSREASCRAKGMARA
jgi:RNA polymerase sigma-70 factor (ECF subfamily)